ncbi:MAG: DNA polymerase III subunit delta' [Rhodospirillales bacterium]|nr:DNA polymerase III subunit delta' [Rhodospirillales bacterium]
MASPDDAPAPIPRENSYLVGHEAAERVLLQAYAAGRLPHAILIAGPRGIGKATLAFRLARTLLSGKTDLPESDPVFRRIASGGHADLMTVERTADPKTGKLRTVTTVDTVRDVITFLRMTPSEGGWRVVIVDPAEDMNKNAANALLKVLEEPPRRAVLFLVSHAPGGLLPTIRSRCRKLVLRSLPDDTVRALLRRYRPGLSDEDAAALARLAEGSIGRALELDDAGGLDLYRDLVGLLAAVPSLEPSRLHGFADRFARRGGEEGWTAFSELLPGWIARLVTAAVDPARAPAEIVPGERQAMERLAARGGLDRWIEVWENLGRLFAQADSVNLDRKQVVLNAFFSLEAATR